MHHAGRQDFDPAGLLTRRATATTAYLAVHVNLDPKYVIDAFTIIDLRVSVAIENWDLALLGKNVTNEDFLTYVNNVPLSGSTFGTNTFYSFNIRERSWWVQLAWHY